MKPEHEQHPDRRSHPNRHRRPAQPPRLDDELVVRETNAAAAAASRIGGRVRRQTEDPAMDPVYQAGGGEEEGWEATDAQLIESATHGERPDLADHSPGRRPRQDGSD